MIIIKNSLSEIAHRKTKDGIFHELQVCLHTSFQMGEDLAYLYSLFQPPSLITANFRHSFYLLMEKYEKIQKVSPEIELQAIEMARGTQKVGQTKDANQVVAKVSKRNWLNIKNSK